MTLIDLLKGNDFSVNANSMLRNYGDEKIVQLTIGRVELSSALRLLLNITSMGEFNKRLAETDNDKLFHLFLYIKTERSNFIVEKNDVITISRKAVPNKSQVMNVAFSQNLTMNSMLEKTRNYMGNKFFTYSGKDNNCQFFIDSILKSNHLSTSENSKFILQDTRHLFENNPKFRKLSNTVTDVAAINNRLNDYGLNPFKSFGNHLLHTIGNRLNIQGQMKSVNINPFRQLKF